MCPALCEAACTCNLNGDPVSTKENERAIIERDYETGLVKAQPPKVRTGKKGVRTAIATAGGVERSSSLLKRVGLYDYLDHIVSARQVAHGKPAPDVYLYACSQLHVQPQECYAVEDSPNGIHSAYSAGCKVFMVPDLTQPDAELEKFIYKKVESLVALKEYF